LLKISPGYAAVWFELAASLFGMIRGLRKEIALALGMGKSSTVDSVEVGCMGSWQRCHWFVASPETWFHRIEEPADDPTDFP